MTSTVIGDPLAAELRAACARAATAEAVAEALFFVARSDFERAREAHRRAVSALVQTATTPAVARPAVHQAG